MIGSALLIICAYAAWLTDNPICAAIFLSSSILIMELKK